MVVSADLHACVEDVSSVRRHDREREREREGQTAPPSTHHHPRAHSCTLWNVTCSSVFHQPAHPCSLSLLCCVALLWLPPFQFAFSFPKAATAASTRFFSFFVCFAVHVVCVCVCVFELTTPALLLFPPFLLPLPLCILSIGLIALTFLSSLIFHHTVLRYECTSPFPNQTE